MFGIPLEIHWKFDFSKLRKHFNNKNNKKVKKVKKVEGEFEFQEIEE